MNQQTHPITIIMADDHEVVREGFEIMISKMKNVKLLAAAAGGEELVTAVQEHLPQIVVTDIKMPGMDGIEATKRIKAMFPQIKVLGFSSFHEITMIRELMKAGASGFVLKTASKEQLSDSFHTVLKNEEYYCEGTTKKLVSAFNEQLQGKQPEAELTEREKQVLVLVATGNTLRQISDELFISVKTVEKHLTGLKNKIRVDSIAGLAVYAAQNGYVIK